MPRAQKTKARTLLVFGDKTYRIEIPEDAKITYGPFSPPSGNRQNFSFNPVGTLRIYQGSKDNIIACFVGVTGFREESLMVQVQEIQESGEHVWATDENGSTEFRNTNRKKKWEEA